MTLLRNGQQQASESTCALGTCTGLRADSNNRHETLYAKAHIRIHIQQNPDNKDCLNASLAQLVEHALRKRMVVGSIPTGGFVAVSKGLEN